MTKEIATLTRSARTFALLILLLPLQIGTANAQLVDWYWAGSGGSVDFDFMSDGMNWLYKDASNGTHAVTGSPNAEIAINFKLRQ